MVVISLREMISLLVAYQTNHHAERDVYHHTQGGVPMIRRIQTILAVLSFVLVYGRIEAQT